MSRPRVPLVDLKLQHSPNLSRAMRREAQDSQPKFSPGVPPTPDGLKDDELRIWDETVKILSDRGILDTGDGPILEHYCVTRARWQREREALEREGTLISTTKIVPCGDTVNVTILNPRLRVVQRTEQALLSLEKVLRLVPELREPSPKTVDKEALFAEFIQKSQRGDVQ